MDNFKFNNYSAANLGSLANFGSVADFGSISNLGCCVPVLTFGFLYLCLLLCFVRLLANLVLLLIKD